MDQVIAIKETQSNVSWKWWLIPQNAYSGTKNRWMLLIGLDDSTTRQTVNLTTRMYCRAHASI